MKTDIVGKQDMGGESITHVSNGGSNNQHAHIEKYLDGLKHPSETEHAFHHLAKRLSKDPDHDGDTDMLPPKVEPKGDGSTIDDFEKLKKGDEGY